MIPTRYEFVTSEQLVTATSGIAATAAVTWNPAELIAAQSAVSVTQKFIAVPPSSLSTTSGVAASYSFEAAAGGPATYVYAGLIAAQSTISATVIDPATVSRGPVPMRRVLPRSWTRVELPMLYTYAGQIAIPRARLAAAYRVTFSPPIQEGLVGARAALSGAARYRDRVEEIVAQDDAELLELLLR